MWANDFDRDKVHMYETHFGASDDHELRPRRHRQGPWPGPPGGTQLGVGILPLHRPEPRWVAARARRLAFFDVLALHPHPEGEGNHRPPVVALENVVGLATSHGGADLAAAVGELNDCGYSVDILTLDARRFVPQSRPRLFLVGVLEPPQEDPSEVSLLRPEWLQKPFNDPDLRTHRALLPEPPPMLEGGLSLVTEHMESDDGRWWDEVRTKAFMSELSPVNLVRIEELRRARQATYRTAYRRTRNGKPSWEIRPDDIAGCLRTARGGSSKQAVVEAVNGAIRVRWMTPREYARLMGADKFKLEGLRNIQALCGFGDAVCVPAVEWLAENYLLPLVSANACKSEETPAAPSM